MFVGSSASWAHH